MSTSLYRGRRSSSPGDLKWRASLRSEKPRQQGGSHLDEISTGVLSPSAKGLFLDHVVGGQILLPGVGYLEMTFIANLGRNSAFTDVAFMRPCWLPQLGKKERCVLRCTRRGDGAFEIASLRGMRSSVESKFTTHFRVILANIDVASKTMPTQLSRAVSFTKSVSKISADEAVVQAQHQATRPQELVSSWSGSLDAMPPTGRDDRMPSLRTRGHDANERTTKILSCASPTDLNASNEESYPTSPLDCAALDSLRFLGISLAPNPLSAVRGIDHNDSSDMPVCSTLRDRGLGEWHGARAGLRNAQYSNTKDCHLPLVPSNRTKAAKDVKIRDYVPQYSSFRNKVAKASASARPRADIARIVGKTVKTLLGTEVPDDAPLMGAGLDSIAAVELISTLSQNLNIEIEPTALFDYPTIASLAKYFAGLDPTEAVALPSLPQASMKPRAQVDVAEVVAKAVEELLGTIVPDDAPLMGAGLDSIAAVELVETLS